MDGYDIAIAVTKGVLALLLIALVYTLFKYPREIIGGILKSLFRKFLFFIPLGDDDDEAYPAKSKLKIIFDDYEKFIQVKSTDRELVEESLRTLRDVDPSFKQVVVHVQIDVTNVLFKVEHIDFYNFHFLVQSLQNEFDDANRVIGIAVNKYNASASYYVVEDSTGERINSLVGQLKNKTAFSIYMLKTKSELRINNSLRNIPEIDLEKLAAQLKAFRFPTANLA